MSEAVAYEYVPDPRHAVDYWTARKVVDEARPPLHRDGYGGERRIWAICTHHSCGVKRTVDPRRIIEAGKGDEPLIGLTFRCKCGEVGEVELRWVNEPRIRERRNQSLPTPGKPRPGYFNLQRNERHGGWD